MHVSPTQKQCDLNLISKHRKIICFKTLPIMTTVQWGNLFNESWAYIITVNTQFQIVQQCDVYSYKTISYLSEVFFLFFLQKHSIRLTATNTLTNTDVQFMFKRLNFMMNRNAVCKNVKELPSLHSVVIKSASFTNCQFFVTLGHFSTSALHAAKMTRDCDVLAHNYPVRNQLWHPILTNVQKFTNDIILQV